MSRLEAAYRAAMPSDDAADFASWVREEPGALSLSLSVHRRRRAAKLSATWTETPESEAEGELIRALLSEPLLSS